MPDKAVEDERLVNKKRQPSYYDLLSLLILLKYGFLIRLRTSILIPVASKCGSVVLCLPLV